MIDDAGTLADLGWSTEFLRQIESDEISALIPLRLSEVHRDRAVGLDATTSHVLGFPPESDLGGLAVGDWVLVDPATNRIARRLDRRSELARRAAGVENKRQLIAANVDTLFVVTSCNADFNTARLERYVALALDAGCAPVVLLTKADTARDPDALVRKARMISSRIVDVIALNAKNKGDLAQLDPWLGPGQTVAFVGSSGVGKSTLVNGLTAQAIATQAVREDDAKGRHTTTARSLSRLDAGGVVIDTPGMRELGLIDVADAIDAVFDDISGLADRCRFRDCAHETEPGCAITAAVAAGQIEAARVERWKKLRLEDAHNTESAQDRRRRMRGFAKIVKEAKAQKTRR